MLLGGMAGTTQLRLQNYIRNSSVSVANEKEYQNKKMGTSIFYTKTRRRNEQKVKNKKLS